MLENLRSRSGNSRDHVPDVWSDMRNNPNAFESGSLSWLKLLLGPGDEKGEIKGLHLREIDQVGQGTVVAGDGPGKKEYRTCFLCTNDHPQKIVLLTVFTQGKFHCEIFGDADDPETRERVMRSYDGQSAGQEFITWLRGDQERKVSDRVSRRSVQNQSKIQKILGMFGF